MDELKRLREKNASLLESLELCVTAMRRLGKEGDDYGGPHLSVCIKELGDERDEARAKLEHMEADRDQWRSWARGRGPNPAEAENERLRRCVDAIRLAFNATKKPGEGGY